ncbi:MAG: hypothetical protein ACLP9L_12945 [Thermoguttaceae bacterium]
MSKGPSDIFFDLLAARPDRARMAIAIDGDRLLADAGVLAKDTIIREMLQDAVRQQARL